MSRPAKSVTPPWRKVKSWRGGWLIEAARNPDGSLRVEEDGLVPPVWQHWRTDLKVSDSLTSRLLTVDGYQKEMHEVDHRNPSRRPAYVRAVWEGFKVWVPAGARDVVRYKHGSDRWDPITQARDPEGRCMPWEEVARGGERNRVHDNPNPLGTMPGTLADLLKTQEWRGSRVETTETPLGKKHTLHHPSGATMTLRAGALED